MLQNLSMKYTSTPMSFRSDAALGYNSGFCHWHVMEQQHLDATCHMTSMALPRGRHNTQGFQKSKDKHYSLQRTFWRRKLGVRTKMKMKSFVPK
jgi:hypothetical protein